MPIFRDGSCFWLACLSHLSCIEISLKNISTKLYMSDFQPCSFHGAHKPITKILRHTEKVYFFAHLTKKYHILPCIMRTHGLILLMYNAQPYFPLKDLCEKVHIIHSKIQVGVILIHSHWTAVVLAVVMFLSDSLGEQRAVPLTEESGVACFKNSCGTSVENHCSIPGVSNSF